MNKYRDSGNISNMSMSGYIGSTIAERNEPNGRFNFSNSYGGANHLTNTSMSRSRVEDTSDRQYQSYPRPDNNIPKVFAERRVFTCFHLDPYSLHKAFPMDIPDMTLICEICQPQKGNPNPFSLKTLKNQTFRFEIFKAGVKFISRRMIERPYRKKEAFVYEFIEFFNARTSERDKAMAVNYLLRQNHLRPIVFEFTVNKRDPRQNDELSPIHNLDHIFVELVFDKVWHMFSIWHKAKNEKGLYMLDEGEEDDPKKGRDAHLYDDMPLDYLDEDMNVAQRIENKDFMKENSDYHPSKKDVEEGEPGPGFWDYRNTLPKDSDLDLRLVYIPEATMNKNLDEDLEEVPYQRYLRDYQLENEWLKVTIIPAYTTNKICDLCKGLDTAQRYIVQGELKRHMKLEFKASLQDEDFQGKKLFFMFEINTVKKFIFVWLNTVKNYWEVIRYDFHTTGAEVKDRILQEDYEKEIDRFVRGFEFMVNDLIRYPFPLKRIPGHKLREYIINASLSPLKLNRKITIYLIRVFTEKWEYVKEKKEIDVNRYEIHKIFDRDFDFKDY